MELSFQIDSNLDIPIYQQLVDTIRFAARKETLLPGQKLPTVQELSQRLGIARGTIKRAYDELEHQGLIEKIQGRGTFICYQPANSGSTNNSSGTNSGGGFNSVTGNTGSGNSGNTGNTGSNTGSSTPSSGASWLRPCSYTYLSSPFGNRDAPTAGASSYHQGVDLAAPKNTPIYATRSGVVTAATFGSAAGYYVSINHGDGFSSIYMHMTHYIVRSGQNVSQGQVIGYCGSTGGSTGPHLHFEVRYYGEAKNPMNYIG